jgi:hypothetical protein
MLAATAAILCVLIGYIIMVHHSLKHGYWFDWEDINNHETIAIGLWCTALGILLGYLLTVHTMG